MFSLDASGSLAGTVVFSKWKGRPYARQLVRPANPKSGGQVSMRAMLKFLSQQWQAISVASRATWEPLADAGVYSEFNAYSSVSLKRNADFLAPVQTAGSNQTDTPAVIDLFTATAGVRSISIALHDDATNDGSWGYLLYRDITTGFTPAFDNLIGIVVADGVNTVTWVDPNLAPDTYYYDAKPFAADGAIGALMGEINATVT